MPTTFNTKTFPAITDGDLTTTLNSEAIFSQNMIYSSVQVSGTGTLSGTMEFYGSNDFGGAPGLGTPIITNWASIGTVTVSASGNALSITNLAYKWIKIKWTDTASTGVGTFNVTIKGDRDFEPTPVGTVIFYTGTLTSVAGYLPCNGGSYCGECGNYNGLYQVIGNTWGGTDATAFNVPDLRGQFLRGANTIGGTTGSVDPDTGRTFGATQSSAFQSHRHNLTLYGRQQAAGVACGANYSIEPYTPGCGQPQVGIDDDDGYTASTVGGTVSYDSETRPTNINGQYWIKY